MSPEPPDLTRLLRDWTSGQPEALTSLIEVVYPELRRIAAQHLSRERQGHTLQPTALVNEAYLRLAQQGPGKQWTDRTHFFAVTARIVRAVLVDHARARLAAKRGAGAIEVELSEADGRVPAPPVDLLDLDAALEALEQLDAQQSRIVELRHFAGLSIEETAGVLDISPATVKRDWLVAKTWIRRHMNGEIPA
ncbi:sigma-70 family RNA polymerase sigma factor [Luteitalea sp.]|uniref:sigma-70 family RNA polymerase sigma factor n=1 Tax=Luteitalea sp. TaxID=2004800 RepID=UPI0025BF65C4|nr:sigma-70 family RNA polymerase sigma factor [Luteitalea sp.]